MTKEKSPTFTAEEFTRLVNNFYVANGLASDYQRIGVDSQLFNYFAAHRADVEKKLKVAFCCICLNPPYWEYAQQMVEGAKKFFLPGHDTSFFLWSDVPQDMSELKKVIDKVKAQDPNYDEVEGLNRLTNLSAFLNKEMAVFPTEAIEWPMPTLMRYSLFLQQEEILKEYDYVFYCDVDMRFVNVVGDEILGDGWTAAQHPMYALRKEYIAPYEPNIKSAAYIPRPGKIVDDNGKPRFVPLYYAGGFQGAKAKDFLEGCKVMKRMIDKDMANSYIPIWNDESIFNRYMFDNPPAVVLSPSYVYPDSLIEEYYKKLWGCDYQPKLVTLTKPFTISKEGGQAVQKMIGTT